MAPGWVCPHCGKTSPYRWMGSFHCREDGEPFTYGANGWSQGTLAGRWPTDWALTDLPYAAQSRQT